MLYIIHCVDKPGSKQLRQDTSAAHREYLQSKPIDIVMAGPMIDESDDAAIGSFLVVEAASGADAAAFSANDPYAKAGLFGSVAVHAWKRTVG